MKWSFDIFPRNNFMLRFLNIDSTDFIIKERMGEMPYSFFLASKHFEPHEEPSKVYEIASFLVRILNGYSLLIHESKKDYGVIYLGDMFREETNEKLSSSTYRTEINFKQIDELLSNIDELGNSEESRIMSLALNGGFVRNVLLIIGTEMSFSNMYKVLDEVKHFLFGKESIKNLVSKNELDRFTHTANNFKALGTDARHGTTKNTPPSNPMSIEEAQLLISNLIIKLLSKYFDTNLKTIQNHQINFKDINLFDD